MRRRLSSFLVPVVALMVLPVLGPGATAAQEKFQDQTSVVVVEVPVQVVKDGKPVSGLTAENFEVWDGEVRRPITSFEVVDLAAPAAPGGRPPRVPTAARRNFLLLFDLAFSNRQSLERAETAARDLLARGLHPQDLVGVALYSPTRGLAMPVGFTSDRRQVERVLDALAVLLRGDVAAAERQRRQAQEARGKDPLGLAAADFPSLVHGLGSLAGVDVALSGEALSWISLQMGPQALDLLANALGHMAAIMNPHIAEAKRGKVGAMTEDLGALARMLREVEGRKTLVFFSEGFDDDVMMGQRNERSASAGVGGTLYGNSRALNDLNRMLEEFRRSGWVIHSVETAGVGRGGVGEEGLFYVANQTGGTYFNNTNRLGEAMERMLAASSQTYLLSFPADDVPADGAFRKLRVELKGAPRGARVVHRAGWHAPTPASQRQGVERRFAAADLVVAGEERAEIPVAVLATPFEGTEERGYVPVVVEIDGAALAAETTAEGAALELYAYAFDGEGRVQDFFAQQLRLDPERAAAAGAAGVRFVGDLRLPPGEHELRLLVRGGASGKTTLDVIPLVVPTPQRVAKRLLPPFFVAGGDSALTVREAGADAAGTGYPFRLGEQPFVPEADPKLAAGEEVRLFVAGYHLATGDLRVSGRVLAADGQPVAGGVLTGLGRVTAGDGLDRVLATFRPEGLAPGAYRLQVTLVEPQGGRLSASAPFRVGGPS